jgi:Na+/H+ antiporter NhaD/arsenite permease-like protein/uncharacterized membrane protein (UPF0127 family)
VITALIIFIITYIFIGLRQVPRIHIDRPAGALVGAVLMVVFGVLTLDQAFAAIDLHTLLLLLGMMIITVYLRIAGFFELMADKVISLSKTPLQLLLFVSLTSGILSALFVNDTICLLYTPIILQIALQLGVNPMPYLLALATSSNVGSVMTVTGNPQNMLIGIQSKIPYLSFLGALFPVAIIGLGVSVVVIRFIYRKEMAKRVFPAKFSVPHYEVNKPLLVKALVVCGLVLIGFSLGYPYSLTAAAGAVMLLLIGGIRSERILEGVDWTLLLFFSGLFVVMHGVEVSGLAGSVISSMGDVSSGSTVARITGLSAVSAVLSNLVSNVPAVMLLKPLTASLGEGHFFWLALAMSSTLAGNLTLIGSVANLIVAQQARRTVEIGFMEYFRVGALITFITIAVGIMVLALEVRFAQGEEAAPSAGCRVRNHKCELSAAPIDSAGTDKAPGQASGRSETITIIPKDGAKTARIYRVVLVCDTAEERSKGLQDFRELEPDEAALFLFERAEPVSFWMGSVFYPIDIIFIGLDRKVARVYPNRRPASLDQYPSVVPVQWVIETAAGSGIKPGDRVKLNAEFGTRRAE